MSRSIPDALAAATTIASCLADPRAIRTPGVVTGGRGRRRPQSLAGGAAGIALLHIERAHTGHGDWTTAHTWLSAAAHDDLSAGPKAGLHFGAPTLAFVTNAAASQPGNYQRALAQLHSPSPAKSAQDRARK